MVCFSGQCRRALALIVAVVVCQGVGNAQSLLSAGFGGEGSESAAFVVDSGRYVVTLGVAGKNLGAAKLEGAPLAAARKVADPISRLVVFELESPVSGAYQLASRAPAGGLLKAPGGSLGGRIVERVESISGKYLPFTLLKLTYDGPPPRSGTPLLDASGAVAAIAYEAVGAKGGYALPVEVLHRALDAVRQGRGVQRAWLGLRLNPAAGLPRVTKTVEQSPANRAGLKAGDVLVEVGGLRVADYGDAVNALFLLRPGAPTRLKVKRGGTEMELELVPAIARR
jgi:membrane-associated protease RseP (regulator of RpoE activity)